MTDLLTPVKTVTLDRISRSDQETRVQPLLAEEKRPSQPSLNGHQDALHILQARPDRAQLRAVLSFLNSSSRETFCIRRPGPASARLINHLVNTTVPDYWLDLGESKSLLLSCLRSIAGVNAVVGRLAQIVSQKQSKADAVQSGEADSRIVELISLLEQLLQGNQFILTIWNHAGTDCETPNQRSLVWKELVSTTTSGRVISTVAQAIDATSSSKKDKQDSWLASGFQYSTWLGDNIAAMTACLDKEDASGQTAVAQLCGRSFGLGHPGDYVR